ncbi:MAG: MBL fold metallo-hydrolase [Spirochaetaceae bacterium]|jgi:phosphoribosyl 1,2-cyclic phosphodiesterase|nr:MBL fold metallo-hydrolase [Spirochaetaceae bacterium]
MFSVYFWGVRGSIACPGSDTVIYGGNTSCLEIRAGKKLVIVDLGTGVRSLGNRLLKQQSRNGSIDADVFITHTHWDHIMGFPMFGPIFMGATTLRIRGPANDKDVSLETVFSRQLSYDYWPVRLNELAAHIEFEHIDEKEINLGDGLIVTSKYLNHPIVTLGYRFEYEGKTIVTAYDTEPYGAGEGAGAEQVEAAREHNERFLHFIRDADVLVYDSMYTEREYLASKKGWGHSSFEEAIRSARRMGVKKLVCFHHDPGRTDRQLDVLGRRYRPAAAKPARKGGPSGAIVERPVSLIIAREGTIIRV